MSADKNPSSPRRFGIHSGDSNPSNRCPVDSLLHQPMQRLPSLRRRMRFDDSRQNILDTNGQWPGRQPATDCRSHQRGDGRRIVFARASKHESLSFNLKGVVRAIDMYLSSHSHDTAIVPNELQAAVTRSHRRSDASAPFGCQRPFAPQRDSHRRSGSAAHTPKPMKLVAVIHRSRVAIVFLCSNQRPMLPAQ